VTSQTRQAGHVANPDLTDALSNQRVELQAAATFCDRGLDQRVE
jgi:hypothetical protein